jgi:glycosyltransferase involved in cell wall biosynthesis
VTHSLDRGGSPISLWNLCRSVQPFHYTVASEKDGALRSRFEEINLNVRILPRKGPLESGLLINYIRLLRTEAIDIVHLNTLTSYYKYPALAARLLRIPVVWFIREDVRQRRCIKLHRWIKSLAARIIPVSDEIARALYPNEISAKVRVIYNGIAPSSAEPLIPSLRQQLGIRSTMPLIGCVAALEQRKRITDLVPALKQLHERGIPAHVACLGVDRSRSQEYRIRLEAQIEAARLRGYFHLLGDFANPAGALLEFNAFVLPTEWEGCARTILEAMLYGCPIVTTSVGGNPELLKHGVHGWLYRVRDVDGLAEGLFHILSSPGAAERFRREARAEVLRRFTLVEHARNVRQVYEEVLGRRI